MVLQNVVWWNLSNDWSFMSWYSIMFERIYAVFHKGASIYPSEEKFDGAVLTCILLTIPIMVNIMSIFHLVRLITDESLHLNRQLMIITGLILIGIHMLWILPKKRYLKFSEEVASFSKRKRLIATIFSWLYFVGSFVFFILFLSFTKPG